MTRRSDRDLEKLERALAEAHRSRPEPRLESDWVQRVMQDVHREGGRPAAPFAEVAFVVWRGAAVAASIALLVAASALFYTGQGEGELTAWVSDDLEAGAPLGE